MGICKCSSEKVLQSKQIISQEEWEAKLNDHYQSILNSCECSPNFYCKIIKQEQTGNLSYEIQGSFVEQRKSTK